LEQKFISNSGQKLLSSDANGYGAKSATKKIIVLQEEFDVLQFEGIKK